MSELDISKRLLEGRKIERVSVSVEPSHVGDTGDADINIIELLRGTWVSEAQGWNLIALPFPSAPGKFRLLMNQFGEVLRFNVPDAGVPNRGVTPDTGDAATDQVIDAIAYEQIITQKAVDDFPVSTKRAPNESAIHHEPGFFLQFINHIPIGHTEEEGKENGPDSLLKIARLATIPHGNSVLAMGTADKIPGPPTIPDEDGLPERIGDRNVNTNQYLAPYKHFEDSPFFGNVPRTVPGFPGFFASNANAILQFANPGAKVKNTTILNFDTKFRNDQLTGIPISNIPFVTREADTTEVHATFWVMELIRPDDYAPPEFIMQYSQTVYLEFFDSDEPGKRIRWPHVSINTLRKA